MRARQVIMASWPVGSVLGIELRLHVTFPLLLALVGALAGWDDGPAAAARLLLLLALIFGSVVLHELGHALVARRFGVGVSSIILLPIGGVAAMSGPLERPRQEFLVAAAGPAVSFTLAGLLWLVFGPGPALADLPPYPASAADFGHFLQRANLFLGLFNLLPAFPMDGGRLLRSALAGLLSYRRATSVAALFGQLSAVGLASVGLGLPGFPLNPFLVLIAGFVFWGARQEERMVDVRIRLGEHTAGEAMSARVARLSPEATLGDLARALHHAPSPHFLVFSGEDLVGILPRDAWLPRLHEGRLDEPLSDLMTLAFHRAVPGETLYEVYRHMEAGAQDVVPVVEEGRVLGIVTSREIARALRPRPVRAVMDVG